MKNKRELAKFLSEKIGEELYIDVYPYDLILDSLVEFEEMREIVVVQGADVE